MFDFTGLEPVTHLPLQSVFPLTPSVNIKPSLFIKPEATGNGCDDYFLKGAVLLVVIEAHEK